MNVLLTGGTGFVGRRVLQDLLGRGHQVTVITRGSPGRTGMPSGVQMLQADPAMPGDWQDVIQNHPVVINLAGASIFHRWTRASKQRMVDSRIRTTRNLVEALSRTGGEGRVLVSASAAGFYGFHKDEDLDESSAGGSDFLAELAAAWEQEAMRAEAGGARVVCCRLGIVLGPGGGSLGKMLPIFKCGLGSPLGSGEQWFPWIHEEDLSRIFLFAMEAGDFSGPVNCTAPFPVRNRDMTMQIGRALRRPTFMPAVPGWLLRMVLGEFGSVLLEGQRALPAKLQQAGFTFRFPTLEGALASLLG